MMKTFQESVPGIDLFVRRLEALNKFCGVEDSGSTMKP